MSTQTMINKPEAIEMTPTFTKTIYLFPIPRRFIVVVAKYDDNKWRFPVLGFRDNNEKTYFVAGAGKYCCCIRVMN